MNLVNLPFELLLRISEDNTLTGKDRKSLRLVHSRLRGAVSPSLFSSIFIFHNARTITATPLNVNQKFKILLTEDGSSLKWLRSQIRELKIEVDKVLGYRIDGVGMFKSFIQAIEDYWRTPEIFPNLRDLRLRVRVGSLSRHDQVGLYRQIRQLEERYGSALQHQGKNSGDGEEEDTIVGDLRVHVGLDTYFAVKELYDAIPRLTTLSMLGPTPRSVTREAHPREHLARMLDRMECLECLRLPYSVVENFDGDKLIADLKNPKALCNLKRLDISSGAKLHNEESIKRFPKLKELKIGSALNFNWAAAKEYGVYLEAIALENTDEKFVDYLASLPLGSLRELRLYLGAEEFDMSEYIWPANNGEVASQFWTALRKQQDSITYLAVDLRDHGDSHLLHYFGRLDDPRFPWSLNSSAFQSADLQFPCLEGLRVYAYHCSPAPFATHDNSILMVSGGQFPTPSLKKLITKSPFFNNFRLSVHCDIESWTHMDEKEVEIDTQVEDCVSSGERFKRYIGHFHISQARWPDVRADRSNEGETPPRTGVRLVDMHWESGILN